MGETVDEDTLEVTTMARDLLCVVANVYLPFLVANEKALREKKDRFEVEVTINGRRMVHKQAPFGWQAKCLRALRTRLNALRGSARFSQLETVLRETGCWQYLSPVAKL